MDLIDFYENTKLYGLNIRQKINLDSTVKKKIGFKSEIDYHSKTGSFICIEILKDNKIVAELSPYSYIELLKDKLLHEIKKEPDNSIRIVVLNEGKTRIETTLLNLRKLNQSDKLLVEHFARENFNHVFEEIDIYERSIEATIEKQKVLNPNKKKGRKKAIEYKLSDIWEGSKIKEMNYFLAKLLGKYIEKNADNKYNWIGKDFYELVAITEYWKKKDWIKDKYKGLKNQTAICKAVYNHFNIESYDSLFNSYFQPNKFEDKEYIKKINKLETDIILKIN